MPSEMDVFVKKLVEIEAIRFGEFVLKSGIKSPIYFDLRVIVSYPQLLKDVSHLLWNLLPKEHSVDVLCGVPYTALPISTVMGVDKMLPILIRRKEAKAYGTKKLIEGNFSPGQKCLIVEDVVTSGTSVLETAKVLRDHGLVVKDALVVLNRDQGGEIALRDNGIKLHSLCHISTLLDILISSKKITLDVKKQVEAFIIKNQVYPAPKKINPLQLSYEDRFSESKNANTRNLCRIMNSKKSNLCLAADLDDTTELLKLIQDVGPHIVCLKTHLDFLPEDEKTRSHFVQNLREMSKKYDFLIFEDRKYADIGATVVKQYAKVVDIADIVTLHGIPGPGVITGLKSISRDSSSGLMVAEMSSEGNLASPDYAKECAKMAESNNDFIMGIVSQSRLTDNIELSQWTPGVNLTAKKDDLAQKYVSPEDAILERGADVIIVGRGITSSGNYSEAAILYKEKGWQAYKSRIGE